MQKVKSIALLIISAILVITLFFSVKWLKQVGFIPIEVVSLTTKLQYCDPEMIRTAVSEDMKQGFFGLKMGVIREKLISLPWVANATVQRCWPNMVKIKIFERQPMAIWNDKGVIDTEGKLFMPGNLANVEGFPSFSGPEEYVNEMVDTYLLILSKLKPVGLAVKKLEIMPDHGWRAMLDNGVTIVLGQIELQERLARFVAARDIVGDGPRVASENLVIDLRYTNGLAVSRRNS